MHSMIHGSENTHIKPGHSNRPEFVRQEGLSRFTGILQTLTPWVAVVKPHSTKGQRNITAFSGASPRKYAQRSHWMPLNAPQ